MAPNDWACEIFCRVAIRFEKETSGVQINMDACNRNKYFLEKTFGAVFFNQKFGHLNSTLLPKSPFVDSNFVVSFYVVKALFVIANGIPSLVFCKCTEKCALKLNNQSIRPVLTRKCEIWRFQIDNDGKKPNLSHSVGR